MGKKYVIYDERAKFEVATASIYTICDSLKEAKEDKRNMFPDGVIYEYKTKGDTLINGKQVSVA